MTKTPTKQEQDAWLRQINEHSKAVHQRYLTGIPRKPIPEGRCVVHNRVRPEGFPNVYAGQRGFRFWMQDLEPDHLEVCDCSWAPQLERHYRVSPHSRVMIPRTNQR
jgi:hypothetical protein